MTAAAPGAGPSAGPRPRTTPALRVLLVVAALRVVLAVAAVVVVSSMVATGLRPDAELAGVLVVVGGVLAGPVVLYLVLAVLALTTLRPRADGARRLGVSWAAVVVDLVLGLAGVVLVVRAAVGGELHPGWAFLVGLVWVAPGVPGLLALLRLRTHG